MSIESINDWLKMHEITSVHGLVGNHMLALVHWFMLILFIFWTAFLIVVLVRFRKKKNPKASYKGMTSHFSTHLEVGVVIVEVVLLMGFAFPLWANQVDPEKRPTGEGVTNIRAVGEQYRWTFQYPGTDQTMGLTAYNRINPSSNGIGLVKEDPNATDDFVSINDLVIPKDRPCVIQVTSKDVIHGLAIIPMFAQQDAIPGSEIPMVFTPTKVGSWDIVCAQLCGAGHAKMVAGVTVMEQKEYDEWYAEQNPLLPKD
ncbi:MAG: cytochrome c oxidase subunit II [Verrucomicrobiota bacterium]